MNYLFYIIVPEEYLLIHKTTNKLMDIYPNVTLAYKILLTNPVPVAPAEVIFKSYKEFLVELHVSKTSALAGYNFHRT